MVPRFEAEIQQLEEFTYVRLVGVIDEDNELAPLVNRIRGQTAIIDLARIEDINNCGVRDWVNCLELLQGREIKVVLVECSPAIVAKLNTVSNFIERGYVKSFYVPYFCQACDQEKALLVDMDEFRGDAPVKTPTCRCDSCDGIMAFDDLEQSYFAFVRDARKAVPPESVRALLAQISPAASGDRKIISKTGVGHSSFAGIPSTSSTSQVSSSQFGTGVSSVVPPSAATLRQLRDKTGLRTLRRAAGDGGGTTRSRSRRLAITLTVVAAALVVVVLLVLLVGLG